jgi:hypothetical protein
MFVKGERYRELVAQFTAANAGNIGNEEGQVTKMDVRHMARLQLNQEIETFREPKQTVAAPATKAGGGKKLKAKGQVVADMDDPTRGVKDVTLAAQLAAEQMAIIAAL